MMKRILRLTAFLLGLTLLLSACGNTKGKEMVDASTQTAPPVEGVTALALCDGDVTLRFEKDETGAWTWFDDPAFPLDQTALELTVGGTGKLTATGAEGITWTSSNAGVAAVGEDGTVTAVAAGTATISASAEGADPVTCTVTVKEVPKKDLVLRSIYQSEGTPLEQFAMWAGDPAVPMTVDGTDSPVQWSTEDSSIATINSDGEVTAVKSGKTMVVAVVDGQTLKCEILVYDR